MKEARTLAEWIGDDKAAVRALLRELFEDDVEVRKRAADTVRRITERDARPLERYADELAGLLESLPVEEPRTRWHLGLVVPRVANTKERRILAGGVGLETNTEILDYSRSRMTARLAWGGNNRKAAIAGGLVMLMIAG